MFLWISITKVVETERTLLGDVDRATKTCGVIRKETIEFVSRFEVMLCVCADRVARLRENFSPANTGQNVLERASELVMIEDFVGAYRLHVELSRNRPQGLFSRLLAVGEVTRAKGEQRRRSMARMQHT